VNEIGLTITESVYVTQLPQPIFQMIGGGSGSVAIFSGAQKYRFHTLLDEVILALT
jgi:hypothetical protein